MRGGRRQLPVPAGAAVAALSLLGLCEAKTWRTGLAEGYQKEFKFLGKFAFSRATADEPGTIMMNAWTFMPGQRVLRYRNDVWFDAYDPLSRGKPSNCASRTMLAESALEVKKGQFYGQAGEVIQSKVVQNYPQYWFLALARCRSWQFASYKNDSCIGVRGDGNAIPNGVFLYYEMSMRNPGGYWRSHFSADEQGLFEFHILMAILCVMLGAVYGCFASEFWHVSEWIAKLQCFAGVLAVMALQHALSLHHYINYASTGVGYDWALKAAEAAESVAHILLTLLLLVLSKGWMITRSRLKPRTRLLQGITSLGLTAVWAVIFVTDLVARDEALTYHRYETSGAKVLVVLRLGITAWFTWCVHRSYWPTIDLLEAIGIGRSRWEGPPRCAPPSRAEGGNGGGGGADGGGGGADGGDGGAAGDDGGPAAMGPAEVEAVLGSARRFFFSLGSVGVVWLMSLPVYSLFAEMMPNYMRLLLLTILVNVTNIAALGCLTLLCLPAFIGRFTKVLAAAAQREDASNGGGGGGGGGGGRYMSGALSSATSRSGRVVVPGIGCASGPPPPPAAILSANAAAYANAVQQPSPQALLWAADRAVADTAAMHRAAGGSVPPRSSRAAAAAAAEAEAEAAAAAAPAPPTEPAMRQIRPVTRNPPLPPRSALGGEALAASPRAAPNGSGEGGQDDNEPAASAIPSEATTTNDGTKRAPIEGPPPAVGGGLRGGGAAASSLPPIGNLPTGGSSRSLGGGGGEAGGRAPSLAPLTPLSPVPPLGSVSRSHSSRIRTPSASFEHGS